MFFYTLNVPRYKHTLRVLIVNWPYPLTTYYRKWYVRLEKINPDFHPLIVYRLDAAALLLPLQMIQQQKNNKQTKNKSSPSNSLYLFTRCFLHFLIRVSADDFNFIEPANCWRLCITYTFLVYVSILHSRVSDFKFVFNPRRPALLFITPISPLFLVYFFFATLFFVGY